MTPGGGKSHLVPRKKQKLGETQIYRRLGPWFVVTLPSVSTSSARSWLDRPRSGARTPGDALPVAPQNYMISYYICCFERIMTPRRSRSHP